MCKHHETFVHVIWTPDPSGVGNNEAVKTIPPLPDGPVKSWTPASTANILSYRPVNSTLNLPVFFFFVWLFPAWWQSGIHLKHRPFVSGVSGYSPKRRLSAAGDERDEAETQRQIKGTKTRAIVPLLWVTNRQVKATQHGWNALASIPFSPPPLPFFLLSLYSLDSL